MARSLKKGPFIDKHLMNKVKKVNESGKKKLLKHGLAVQQFILNLLDTHLLFIMVKNSSQFM